MMMQDTMAEALKWAFLVFAAGFVGFFGKYLGRILLERIRKDKASGAAAPPPASPGKAMAPSSPPEASRETPPGEARLPRDDKLMKKVEKSRLKLEKKQGRKVAGEEDR
jgi:hypothetical protein